MADHPHQPVSISVSSWLSLFQPAFRMSSACFQFDKLYSLDKICISSDMDPKGEAGFLVFRKLASTVPSYLAAYHRFWRRGALPHWYLQVIYGKLPARFQQENCYRQWEQTFENDYTKKATLHGLQWKSHRVQPVLKPTQTWPRVGPKIFPVKLHWQN